MRKLLLLSILTFILVSASAFGQSINVSPTTHEPILLPVSQQTTPGAFGSLWSTDVYAANANDEPVEIYPAVCAVSAPCPPTFSVPAGAAIPVPVDQTASGEPAGVLMWVPRAAVNKMSFSLRVYDQSRELLSFGTSIPVVRENELLSGQSEFFPIPVGDVFRQSLRVYDISDGTNTQFFVEIFDMESGLRLAAETVAAIHAPVFGPVPIRPAVVEIHQLASRYPAVSGSSSVRVRVTPVVPTTKYWAFLTVTNNDLQHVTTMPPE